MLSSLARPLWRKSVGQALLNASGEIPPSALANIDSAISGSQYIAVGEDKHLSAGFLDLNFKLVED